MIGCAAVNCSNSSEEGFIMKRFPRDPKRRKEWLIKMRRDKWKPNDNSCLCEAHFAPEMWEKVRVDGKRKLKNNAVPTNFFFSSDNAPKRKPPTARKISASHTRHITTASLPKMVPEVEFEIGTHSDTPVPTSLSVAESLPSTSVYISPSISSSPSSEKQQILKGIVELGVPLQSKLQSYDKLYLKEKMKTKKYKRLLRNALYKLKNTNKSSNLDVAAQHKLLKLVFNEDQINALRKRQKSKSTKLMKWSNNTITRSLKLKFSCGNNGYEELLKQGYPLPSVRTLQRRLQRLTFDTGILNEVFCFLKIKVNSFNPHEKDCTLTLDEAAITSGKNYDSSLQKYFGDITLHGHTGVATHVLVFMLGGVNTRWKQVVAYHFTGNSVNGAALAEVIKEILKKSSEIGLNVISITSDMGACNQSLWNVLGISAGRNLEIKNKVIFPFIKEQPIYVFADVPHLFKNIKGMLMNNKIINIPPDLQEKYKLPTNQVKTSHITELIQHQEKCFFKLAPKLSEEDLLPSHFNKMKVSTSTNVISHSVSSALKFLSEILDKPEYLTTAWFLDYVEKWFYLMSSRHPSSALSKFNIEKYEENLAFLKEFMYLFSRIEVGLKKLWKPSQTGVLISTQSVMDVQLYVLEERKYEFILTSRFSQDCLENLFSVLRATQIIPNAMQVKNNLKLISVSQYLKQHSKSSYEEDDREFLSGFLDTLGEHVPEYCDVNIPPDTRVSNFNLSYSELNSLYNIAGYIIHSIQKTSKTCENCIKSVASKTPIYKKFSKLVNLRRFRSNTLWFCTEECFYFFLEMETVFHTYLAAVSKQNVNIKEFFLKKLCLIELNIPLCHNLKKKIVTRYITFRLRIFSKKVKSKSSKFGSKSMFLH